MTIYVAAWLVFACPLGMGRLSWPVKALLCQSRPEFAASTFRSEVDRRVARAEPQSAVLWLEVGPDRVRRWELRP